MIKNSAIILASGLGTRMRPLTEHKPKPLIEVRGVPMIETVIKALKQGGVDTIFVVVGYQKEQFNYLTIKYKNLILIENPDYMTVNNISSVYYARDVLKKCSCFICEADLYITGNSIFNGSFPNHVILENLLKGNQMIGSLIWMMPAL